MALLNFITQYKDVAKYKDLTASSPSLEGSQENDYVKLIFTKDGHIITHGTDYIPWGNGTIPIDKLPITDGDKPDNTHLWSSETINQKINESYVINSAMRFKGTIGLNPTYNGTTDTKKYVINGEKSDIPSAQVGDTYRVTKSGNYMGFTCETGDLLMCITASTDNQAAEWTVAQTNINGTVDYLINNRVYKVYSNDSPGENNKPILDIYAPVSSGSAGNILISGGTGKAPTWANPESIIVGTASKVAKDLTNGVGLLNFSYNGSTAVKISLAPATTSSIGGVSIDNDKKPTISVDEAGKIFLTKTNIENAYGGKLSADNTWRDIKIGNVSIGNKTLNIDASGDIYVAKTETDDTVTIDFGISWYNLDTGNYETV